MKQFLTIESPLKMMKYAFYFILRILTGKKHPQVRLQRLQKV